MDRLHQDRLRIDDPSCSQYQIVLDLLGKDEQQLLREKQRKEYKMQDEYLKLQHEQRRQLEDGHASAYLVHAGEQDGTKKQLLFTVPEHPKPKFLSKFSLLQLKEAEQLGILNGNQEDNAYIFQEIMKNELIAQEFQRIRDTYGDDAYELNRISLLNFIKKGRQNFTYSVKYYGIDEGQIGILSRKVPFDLLMKQTQKTVRLPKIQKPQKEYYYEEQEYSEDEVFSVEVTDESDDEVPQATKPQLNLDIVQGTVAGTEFQQLKKDSLPLHQEESQAEVNITQPKKKTKRVKQTRRVKKKKMIKKAKPVVESMETESTFVGFNQSQSEVSQMQDASKMQSQFDQTKTLHSIRSQPNLKNSTGPIVIPLPEEQEALVDKDAPYLINFRELFKRCELSNIKDFKKPEPEKYDSHIVHSYSLPKGLHALKRQQVLSEAEAFDKERYSKRNIQLHMIDKGQQRMNLGGQTYGLKGSKVKPIYFPFNHNESQSIQNTLQSIGNGVENSIMTQPIKAVPKDMSQNIQGSKILIDDSQRQNTKRFHSYNKTQPTQKQDFSGQKTPAVPEQEHKSQEIDRTYSDQSQNQVFNNYIYDPSKATNNPLILNSNDVSHIQPKNLTIDKNNSQASTLNIQNSGFPKQIQAAKKNNQIIKNLARGKKKLESSDAMLDQNFDLASAGIFDKNEIMAHKANHQMPKTLMRNQSDGALQFGFQISNQMKISYLMDTKKILENKKRTQNIGFTQRPSQVDSDDDDEDKLIFKEKPNYQKSTQDIQLPQIKNTASNNNFASYGHPNTTGSQFEGFNPSNVKIVCRIRPPKITDSKKDSMQNSRVNRENSINKSYTSVRHRQSRSNSKDISSPFKHTAPLRHTSREGSISQNQSQTFTFDSVYNETIKQDKFYRSVVSPTIKSFVEGENASILLFGPTDGGKTYTLKGKTGVERGILPRAAEDIFNIVRNSEQREEDYEALNNKMMQYSDDEDQIQEGSQHFSKTYDSLRFNQTARNFNSIDQSNLVPERMFLKVSIYQIFVDKVLDLLNTQHSVKGIQVDQYIDQNSQEVVSKPRNVTEKAVFALEDFYSVLQEAFKNRRIESVNMQEQELRKKSHFIISLTLMKRTFSKRLVEISTLNFVELTGSEQAVAEERFYKDTSIKQFVTKSFNGISSSILKSALKKKTSTQEDGDVKLINCIRNTLTQNSSIILICNVNPAPSFFEHSLPAIKFCARIRECIVKKLNRGKNNQRIAQGSSFTHQNSSIEEINYPQDNDKSSSNDTIKEIIDHMKEELASRQLNSHSYSLQEIEKWCFDKQETIERLISRVYASSSPNVSEKQKVMLLQELNFLKESIQRFRANSQSSTNKNPATFNFQDSRAQHQQSHFYHSERGHSNNLRGSYENQEKPAEYNPYQSLTYNYLDGQDKLSHQSSEHRSHQQRSDRQDSLRRTGENFILTEDQGYQEERKTYLEHQRLNSTQTPSFASLTSQNNQNQRTMLRPHHLQTSGNFQQPDREKQPSTIRQSPEKSLDEYNNSLSINEERRQYQNYVAPDSKQISRIEQIDNLTQSNVACTENEFLNRHLDRTLTNRYPSASGRSSPGLQKSASRLPASNQSSKVITLTQVPQSQSVIKNPLANYSTHSHKSQIQNLSGQLNQSVSQLSRKAQSLKQNSVYRDENEALNDINRLIRLSDFDGLKRRVLEIYREKESQDQLIDQQEELIGQLKEETQLRSQIIDEQEQYIKSAQQDFQNTIDEINQHRIEQEQNNSAQAYNVTGHLMELQQKVQELEKQNYDLERSQEILDLENKKLAQTKLDTDQIYKSIKEENEKLRQNYDILKEHEINIIKDQEGKKSRELQFFEQKIQELRDQLKEEQTKQRESDELVFKAKEETRRLAFDYEKVVQDRTHLQEQIQDLKQKIDSDQELQQELKRQIDQIEQEYRNLESQRDKIDLERKQALHEISKLHELIEEMDRNIQREQEKQGLEGKEKEQIEREIRDLKDLINDRERIISQKGTEIQIYKKKEEDLQRQLGQMARMNDGLEKQLIAVKSKEYDKVDTLKKAAEIEAKLIYLQADNENLVRERNNLDIANVNLNKEKQELEQQLISLESELEFFRRAHEEHLDKFDSKFDQISQELLKLKNENIQLKESQKLQKKALRQLEDERDELRDRLKLTDRRNDEMAIKLQEMESEVRIMLNEREKDIRDQGLRENFRDTKNKDENKTRMLEDIQNMIRNYKNEKNMSRSGYTSGGLDRNYSTHSSGYY